MFFWFIIGTKGGFAIERTVASIGTAPRLLWHARSIGILGGTFNPVHCGHIEMAKAAMQEFCLDQVWLMPSHLPPHKPVPSATSALHRWRMVELACENEPQLVPSALELRRSGTTYTVDTLRALTHNSDDRYVFIVGTDTVMLMETWKQPQAVFDLCDFIAFARAGVDDAAVGAKIMDLKMRFGARIYKGMHRCMDISSTQIRQRIQIGCPLAGLVPAAVEAYIEEHGVYSE